MPLFLAIIQVVLAVLLVTFILLQQRGTSLGGAFGGEGNIYRTRRGAERVLFIATIVVAVTFLATSVFAVILR
jgi:preprotein translocase subunit SecG